MKKPHIYQGRELTDADLAQIKAAIESSDSNEHIDEEMRAIAATEWPDLLAAKMRARPTTHH